MYVLKGFMSIKLRVDKCVLSEIDIEPWVVDCLLSKTSYYTYMSLPNLW